MLFNEESIFDIMTDIEIKVDEYLTWYRTKVPKSIRFLVFYLTTPLWVPVVLILGAITLLLGGLILGGIELWKDFDK